MESWNVDADELIEIASENNRRINSKQILTLDEYSDFNGFGRDIRPYELDDNGNVRFIVSTLNRDAAVYLLDRTIFKNLAKEWDSDLLIGAFMYDKLIIVPYSDENYEIFCRLGVTMREDMRRDKRYLSDHPYVFKKGEGFLGMKDDDPLGDKKEEGFPFP